MTLDNTQNSAQKIADSWVFLNIWYIQRTYQYIFFSLMISWIDEYKARINEKIYNYFTEHYRAPEWSHEEILRDAVVYAIKTEDTRRIHPILSMIAYEEIIHMEANSSLHILIGIEFFYTWLLIHTDIVGIRDIFLDNSPMVLKKYWENLSLIVWDILFELWVEILTQSGDAHVFSEAMLGFWHTWYMRWVARDIITDHKTISEKEYLLMYDEKISRWLSAALMCGGHIAWWLSRELSDQFRQFATFLARMYQVWRDIRIYESTQGDVLLGMTRERGVVDFLWYEKAKEIESELYYQLMEMTRNFRNTKFIDIIDFFRSGEVWEL